MADSKVEVLVDRKAGDLSLTSVGDDGTEHETTLSLEEAWALVASLNQSIQKLLPAEVNTSKNKGKLNVTIDLRGEISEELVNRAVRTAVNEIKQQITKQPLVRAAVLEAIGADQQRLRHLPPGDPRTIPIEGLRETELF